MKKTYLTIELKSDIKIEYNKKNRIPTKEKTTITKLYWKNQSDYTLLNNQKNLAQTIYEELTDLFFYEDIYIYSSKELFIDITNYLAIYNLTAYSLTLKVKSLLHKKFNILAQYGIGPNLFLSKTACNILTKVTKSSIASLMEEEYIKTFSKYEPLTDLWQISTSMQIKLKQLGIINMEDVRNYDYSKLYQIFGYNAEYLINHALGIEPATIKSLTKQRFPKTITSSEHLKEGKHKKETRIILKQLLDYNILKLLENNQKSKALSLQVNYKYNLIPPKRITKILDQETDSYTLLSSSTLQLFDQEINLFFPIEKITIQFTKLSHKTINNSLIYYQSTSLDLKNNKNIALSQKWDQIRVDLRKERIPYRL